MKLIKTTKGHYILIDDTKETNDKDFIVGTSRDTNASKLSIKNCDEIFEVIDVYKLAKQKYPNVDNEDYEYDSEWQMLSDEYKKIGFIQGAKSILELNKDKLFTVDQLNKAYYRMENRFKNEPFEVFLEHIQQPTEMEVEIEMEYVGECNGNNGDGCFQDSPGHNCGCFEYTPKLDKDGCIIIKKIV